MHETEKTMIDHALVAALRLRFEALVLAVRSDDVTASAGALANMRRGLVIGLGYPERGPELARTDRAMEYVVGRARSLSSLDRLMETFK